MPKYLDATAKLLDPRTREVQPDRGDTGSSQGVIKSVDVDSRTVTAVVSTPNPDRFEEIVLPEAYKAWLPVFESNPVFVASHNSGGGLSGEPTVIGSWSDLSIQKDGLHGTARFAKTPLAEQHFQLYAEGHMRAFSVGWITHEWEMREFEITKGVSKKIRVFTEVELIEISAVAIPANRESLVRAASAAVAQGADHEALRRIIREEIKNCLNTEPGGQLCNLLQDVVEVVRGRGADGLDDGPPRQASGDVPGRGDQIEAFMKKLRQAVIDHSA